MFPILTEICGSSRSDLECSVVDGRMTLISDENNFDYKQIDSLICDALNDDSLKYVHPTIQHVQCIPLKQSGLTEDGINGIDKPSPSFKPVSQEIGAYGLLVSVAAALVVILGIYGYKRRHRPEKPVKKEVGPLDDSDLVNMSKSISYEVAMLPYIGQPAMDFTSIHTAPSNGGIDDMARNCHHCIFPVSQSNYQQKLHFLLYFQCVTKFHSPYQNRKLLMRVLEMLYWKKFL